jgi:hypothetical protein
MFQTKHYNKSDTSQDDNLRRHEEECEESNKEDKRITVEDEEQCDEIEVSLIDNDGELPKKTEDFIIGAFEGGLGKISMRLKVFVLEHNKVIYTCMTR